MIFLKGEKEVRKMFERTKQFIADIREARKCAYSVECGDSCRNGFRATNGYSMCETFTDKAQLERQQRDRMNSGNGF
jgi:hypothetical protein